MARHQTFSLESAGFLGRIAHVIPTKKMRQLVAHPDCEIIAYVAGDIDLVVGHKPPFFALSNVHKDITTDDVLETGVRNKVMPR